MSRRRCIGALVRAGNLARTSEEATHLHSGDFVDEEQENVRNHERPRSHRYNTRQLLERHHPVSVHPTAFDVITAELGDRAISENAGKEGSRDPPDSVETKSIERVVYEHSRADEMGP